MVPDQSDNEFGEAERCSSRNIVEFAKWSTFGDEKAQKSIPNQEVASMGSNQLVICQ